MEPTTYQFELLSDTFAHGAYQTQDFNRPELRAPSVKGMIRWWHEALGHSKADTSLIFGTVKGGNKASPVTFRIEPIKSPNLTETPFLPHKSRKPKFALTPGTFFRLSVMPRREGLSRISEDQLKQATEAWLLLGSIGQRSNRAAGSILWDQCPSTQKEFEITASELTSGSKISFAVLDRVFADDIEAREIAGDFLSEQAFQGTAPFGSAGGFDRATNQKIERKPSPLKLKCVEFERQIKLLALWDHRKESPRNLENGIQKLRQANKEIGELLHSALPQLTS